MKIRVVHTDGAVTELDNVEQLYFLKGEGKCELCTKACSPGVCAECSEGKLFKRGHWIFKKSLSYLFPVYCCSECNKRNDNDTDNYCPKCGARMVEQQESEEEK